MAEITLAQARELCTAAELRVVKASLKREVQQLDAQQLKRHVAQARKLRDKWRDLSHQRQRKVHKAGAGRAAAGSERRREKGKLFAQVLSRFEARLQKVTASAAGRGASVKAEREAPSKQQRTDEHRAARAQTKRQLERGRAAMGAKARSTNPADGSSITKPPSAMSSPPASAGKPTQAKPSSAPAAPAVGKPATTAARSPKSRPMAIGSSDVDKSRQRSAKAAAKLARVETSGLRSRIRGHVSARGKRAQGRRDSKQRGE